MTRLVASKRARNCGRTRANGLSEQLAAGCADIGLTPSDETCAALLRYTRLIARWNKVHNLTAIRDPSAMVTQHLLDSLAIIPALERHLGKPSSLADVGSGAGLPGMVLAIFWPCTQVTLIEPANKKAAFLRQAAAELRLPNVTVLAERVQSINRDSFKTKPDLLLCRAYTALADFVQQCLPLAGPDTIIAAMKGPRAHEEIAAFEQRVTRQDEQNSPVRAAKSKENWFCVKKCEEIVVPGLDAQRYLVLLHNQTHRSQAFDSRP